MSDSDNNVEFQVRSFALIALALTGVVIAGAAGALTNSVNGAISPEYFIAVLRWHGVDDVWRASIAQGIFEGFCFGLAYAHLFAIGVGIITGVNSTYGFAFRYLWRITLGALVCWALGGLAGMGLAAISPEFYRQTFVGVPEGFGPLMGYAWVGGSIWGIEFGGFVCVALGLVVLRANWRRQFAGRIVGAE